MEITTTFSARDIVCDGCANAIKKALGRHAGLTNIDVDIAAKQVTVTHDPSVPPQIIAGALEAAGFPATETK